MNRVRLFLAVAMTAATLLFALQNLTTVDVDFLGWQFEASVSVISLTPFLLGLLVGGAAAFLSGRQRSSGTTAGAAGSAPGPGMRSTP